MPRRVTYVKYDYPLSQPFHTWTLLSGVSSLGRCSLSGPATKYISCTVESHQRKIQDKQTLEVPKYTGLHNIKGEESDKDMPFCFTKNRIVLFVK